MEVGVSDNLPSSGVMHRDYSAVPQIEDIASIKLQGKCHLEWSRIQAIMLVLLQEH